MPYELNVQQEQLTYTGHYSRPLFELWGNGGKIVGGIYGALSPYGVNLPDIHLELAQTSPSDPIVTTKIGAGGVYKFTFDRVELTFFGFSEEVLKKIPAIINASTEWIRAAVPDVKFLWHRSVYFAHGQLKGTTIEEFLRGTGPRNLKSAGIDRGSGAIYNCEVPELGWTTQLVLDRSIFVPGGLYIMLALTATHDVLNYDTLLIEGRSYLSGVLNELGLSFPELNV